MYLSRIALDPQKYETMRALYNVERLHGMIESSFSGDRNRNLWRLDQLNGKSYLILLSPIMPETDSLPRQIGEDGTMWETKSYEKFLSQITKEIVLKFRLTANPTVCMLLAGSRGKVKAIVTAPAQREWLKKQGVKRGFSVQDGQFDVVESNWRTFKKGDRENRILAASFEGTLTVTDADLFKDTLINGIGREKAYGMGLLTVIPS